MAQQEPVRKPGGLYRSEARIVMVMLVGGGFMKRTFSLLAAAWFLATAPSMARADACLADLWDNGILEGGYVFPNWTRVWAGDFTAMFYDGYVGTETIRGLTVVNFGTADNSDIKAVYWQAKCGATTTGLQTLTWAGTYTEDTGSYPAWTWAGTTPNFQNCAALWPLGPGGMTVDLYVDIDPCPTTGQTVKMGFPVNSINNTTWWGSMYDNEGCMAPWGDVRGPYMTILYTLKLANMDNAAPGDAVTYTIYYGRPGTANLSSIEIVDTQPPYTHYVAGSASPNPDTFWDPNFGPPVRLKWTIPGPLTVAGGPTGAVTFDLSVDWGNGNAFESGSGDVAAPEGVRLNNGAQVFFNGIAGCGVKSVVNPPITTVVRRYMFWKLANNDALFSQSLGQSPDEITYEIFLKNMSQAKTWWDVHVWDSVPPEVDFFGIDCGFDDPCTGWTVTPTGCAPAGPGWDAPVPGTILLTWRLDMPPGLTLTLRWKGKVKSTASAGATAVNRASVLAYGRTNIVGGTGHAGRARNFSHQAPILLPTTYISYVGLAGSDDNKGTCEGYFIAFFPLNRKTQFELRGIQYQGAGWSTAGGVSSSIGCLLGDCISGFAGNAGCSLGSGAISGGGIAGCKAERVPARYDPVALHGICPVYPFNFIYKLTSNSPVLWQALNFSVNCGEDTATFSPATTLTYVGLMHYLWRRTDTSGIKGSGDSLSLINTSLNASGAPIAGLQTSVHIFKFDYATLSWQYVRTAEIDDESQFFDMGTMVADDGPWRTVSSDAQLAVYQGMDNMTGLGGSCTEPGDTFSSLMPIRETGNVVSQVGVGTFYGLATGMTQPRKVVIGNTGAVDATYRIWHYVPYNTLALAPMPENLNGSSGFWALKGVHDVPAGLAAAGNPRIYDTYSPAFNESSLSLFKVEVTAGGPIQVLAGHEVYSWTTAGAVLHAANGNQVGTEYWLHHAPSDASCGGGPGFTSTQAVNVFCPKTGMAIRATAESGYTATYTTTGPDQCVSFTALTSPAVGNKRNYIFRVLPGPSSGDVIAQFLSCLVRPKEYTAPFLRTGTHYQIIAPPVVFLGQSFWITVIVLESIGTTKTDYAGTTSFSSTDPGAKIQGASMDSYNYTWNGCGPECGVKVFVNVMFTRLGLQTIVAVDMLDGSINGLTAILVVAADVKLEKRKRLSIAASGDTVQFQICWSNFSSATAFSFTITDAVPMGTTYVPEVASTMLCGSSAPVPGITVWYSTATTTTPPGTFTSVPGTGSPLGNTRWLRWTIRDVYVNSTGCVCFKVSVN